MPTESDLRDALYRLEAGAETVAEASARIHRSARSKGPRLRILVGASVAAAAVVAVVVATQIPSPRSGHQTGAASAASALHYTFSVGPIAGYSFIDGSISVEGGEQRDIFTAEGTEIGLVEIEVPSYFDLMPLKEAQPITISGHRAVYAQQVQMQVEPEGPVPGQPTGIIQWVTTVPVVAWQLPSGDWFVVRASAIPNNAVLPSTVQAWGPDVRARLVAIATSVRMGVPSVIPIPFRLGPVSDGSGLYVDSSPMEAAEFGADMQFSTPAVTVSISVVKPAQYNPVFDGSIPIRIGSYSGEMSSDCESQPTASGPIPPSEVTTGPQTCDLMFRAGVWQVDVQEDSSNRGPLNIASIVSLASHMTFAPEASESTWFDARTVFDS